MKYELVKTDTKQFFGKTLYRIRALVAIGSLVAPGDLGGYVESEKNLAQVSGNAWVYGDAQVYGNAQVYGDARVYGDAWVSGDAWVYGDAQVSGDAQVYGNARVSGNAQVYGVARVSKRTHWLLIGPAKSSGRFTTAFVDEKIGVRVACGCFTGTVAEFSKQIEETHKNNKEHLEQYRLICQFIGYNFGVEK